MCPNKLRAQDTVILKTPPSPAIDFYRNYIGENSHLYNGSEYIPEDSRIRGHACFLSDSLIEGLINYDDILYRGVKFTYDIVRDELIINRYNENYRIKLVNEKIAYFRLLNHFFVRIVQDSINKPIINTGFYECVYNGGISFFEKHIKKKEEKISTYQEAQEWYEEHDFYFIKKEKHYYPIHNKTDLVNILKEHKKEIQKFIRKNKIRFKEDPETAILKAVKYYEQIKN